MSTMDEAHLVDTARFMLVLQGRGKDLKVNRQLSS